MLYRLITAEEILTKRRSGMRLFVRMDVSVLQKQDKFYYMVNEITRSHQTALFLHWDGGRMDHCIQELVKAFHYIAGLKMN
jgi:hypothetical protein